MSTGCSYQEMKGQTRRELALRSFAFVHGSRKLCGPTLRYKLHVCGANVAPRVIGMSTFVRYALDSFLIVLGRARPSAQSGLQRRFKWKEGDADSTPAVGENPA